MESSLSGPLSGFRILDLTSVISGPVATMLLADQGADVIKIERPGGGDFTRKASNSRGGFSASFLNNNRGKRSVAVDLKDPRGVDIIKRIAEGVDVVIQNFRPGVVERIGIGAETLLALNPRLVYVSISGFGDEGPYASMPVYDPLIQALSGLTTIQGGSDDERPRLVRTILPDKLTGFIAAQAVTAALLARERTQCGQHVRLSMLDSVIAFLWHSDMSSQTFVGDEVDQAEAQSFIDLIYETEDDYISVAVQTDRQWEALVGVLERPDLLEDDRFKTTAMRQKHIDARLQLTQEVLRTRPAAVWLELLQSADVPCAPVLRRRAVVEHEQVKANAILHELEHGRAGRLRQARPAARFSNMAFELGPGAPELGQHSREVLREAGIDDAEIDLLAREGVIEEPN